MDEQMLPPSERGIFAWLRLNLALTVTIFSIVSGIGGALISGTLHVAAADYQLADVIRVNTDQQKQIDQVHTDMIDVDRRLNSGVSYTSDMRRQTDAQIAALQERIAVLEAQIRFLADRAQEAPTGRKK